MAKEKTEKKRDSFEIKLIIVLTILAALSIAAFFVVPELVNGKKHKNNKAESSDKYMEINSDYSSNEDFGISDDKVEFIDTDNCFDELEASGCKDDFFGFMRALYSGDENGARKYIEGAPWTDPFYTNSENEAKTNESLDKSVSKIVEGIKQASQYYNNLIIGIKVLQVDVLEGTLEYKGGISIVFQPIIFSDDNSQGLTDGSKCRLVMGEIGGDWKALYLKNL